MGIVNRRNAVLGWIAWQAGKRVARRKVRTAVPGRAGGTNRPNRSALVLALGSLAGALWLWRRRRREPSAFDVGVPHDGEGPGAQ